MEESGRIMDSHKLDRRSYLTSPSLTHKLYRVVTIFPIIGCITDILFYRLINRYLITSHLSLRMVGDPTIRRGTYNDTLLDCRLIYRNVDYRNDHYDNG